MLGILPSVPPYIPPHRHSVRNTKYPGILEEYGTTHGGTTREDPKYPGILSIPDTVSVRGSVWGDNSGGSRVSRDSQDIPGSPVATHAIPDSNRHSMPFHVVFSESD